MSNRATKKFPTLPVLGIVIVIVTIVGVILVPLLREGGIKVGDRVVIKDECFGNGKFGTITERISEQEAITNPQFSTSGWVVDFGAGDVMFYPDGLSNLGPGNCLEKVT